MSTTPIVGIIAKHNLHISPAVSSLLDSLKQANIQMRCFESSNLPITETFSSITEVSHLLVLGGDGTIIKTVREFGSHTVPIVSVNLGTVGFMADLSIEEATSCLPQILQGEALVDVRQLMNVALLENGKVVFESQCLNDVVLAKGKIARLIDIEARINNTYLTDYNADGLLLSTPTGSTAYNLSAGGPIMHPSVQAMILTAINPYSLSQKPIVVPASSTITLIPKFSEAPREDEAVYLTIDGQTFKEVHQNSTIEVSLSSDSITFLRKKSDSFFHTLRSKLKWGEKPKINHHADQAE